MSELERDSELQLIIRSQNGDVSAFNELILHYQQMIYNVILRMLSDRDTAADVTQDTFIAAFRGVQTFRGGTSFRAWLLRIASNQACDHWRRTHRHPVESLEIMTDEDEPHAADILSSLAATGQEGNPEESLLSQELHELIQQALEELPLDQRVAVRLLQMREQRLLELVEDFVPVPGIVRTAPSADPPWSLMTFVAGERMDLALTSASAMMTKDMTRSAGRALAAAFAQDRDDRSWRAHRRSRWRRSQACRTARTTA